MPQNDEFNLESLKVWQMAIDFSVTVCKDVLSKFPKMEMYCLSPQLRRSVQSIPANIAEGHGRYHYLDAVRFCYIARGSLEETYSHLVIAKRLEYISDPEFNELKNKLNEINRSLNGYIAFLKKSKQGFNEPGYVLHEPTPEYSIDPLPTQQINDSTFHSPPDSTIQLLNHSTSTPPEEL